MWQIAGVKIQITSILAIPKPYIDIEKNKRTVNITNPIISKKVAIIINPDFILYTSSKNISFFLIISF